MGQYFKPCIVEETYPYMVYVGYLDSYLVDRYSFRYLKFIAHGTYYLPTSLIKNDKG